jgi:hypothetical protein
MKRQQGLISPRHVRHGRISKDYGALACWKGVPEVEELWNTVSATKAWIGFAGFVRAEVDHDKSS